MFSLTVGLVLALQSGSTAGLPPVEDTTLDASRPNGDFGRALNLGLGPGKAVLIRFPQLSTAQPARRRVRSATMFLTVDSGSPQIESIATLRVPWGEGGDTGMEPSKAAGSGAATWNASQAGSGGAAWAEPGAAGGGSARTISTAQASVQGGLLRIDGLAEAVQEMIDDPGRNYGFRIVSATPALLASGERPERARLVVEFADAGPASGPDLTVIGLSGDLAAPKVGDTITWTATFANLGSEPASVVQAEWIAGSERGTLELAGPIAPGKSAMTSFRLAVKPGDDDQRYRTVRVRILTPDVDPANNTLVTSILGRRIGLRGDISPADWRRWQEAAMELNAVALPHSRFSFAPEGSLVRVGVVPASEPHDVSLETGQAPSAPGLAKSLLGLPEGFVRPPAGAPYSVAGLRFLGVFPETRDDLYRLGALPLPPQNWASRTGRDGELPEHGYLSGPEVGLLNGLSRNRLPLANLIQNIPRSAFVRCFDGIGLPLANATITIRQSTATGWSEAPVFTGKTTAQGSFLLPSRPAGESPANPFGEIRPDGTNAWLMIEASLDGERAVELLPVWVLWHEMFRGNGSVAALEMRWMLGTGALVPNENLAKAKAVSDGAGRFPAELTAVVDGDPSTDLEFSGELVKQWVEIDLGKDRTFGEIVLTMRGQPWEAFDIVTYSTGETLDRGFLWFREIRATWRLGLSELKGDQVQLRYRGRATRARYIRIIPRAGSGARLSEVAVTAAS